MAEAWFCPSCQKYHAPHVETCPAPAAPIYPLPTTPWPYPQQPTAAPWKPPFEITCGTAAVVSDPSIICVNGAIQ